MSVNTADMGAPGVRLPEMAASGVVSVIIARGDGVVSHLITPRRLPPRRDPAHPLLLTNLLPVATQDGFRAAMAAVQREGGMRTFNWHAGGACWPGDVNEAGPRRAILAPCTALDGGPSVAIVISAPPGGDGQPGGDLQERLAQAHSQLMHSEKMAAVGQLAAGVAHEINNPVGFVFSNLGTLAGYVRDLLRIVDAIDDCASLDALRQLKAGIDYAYIRDDVEALIVESEDGIDRIKRIIAALKDFTHQGDDEFREADINRGIETTLKVVNSELKYRAEVVTEFGDIPAVECIASQVNQVVMNLLVNAAHAMNGFGRIVVRTGLSGDNVWIEVEDNGCGMSKDLQARIFEPFFTTKPVGQGTGLGLALSYNIVQKHNGRIDVDSESGRGTRFRVCLPVSQSRTGS